MGIKTREELEAKIVAEMVAEQSEVTVYEPKTAIRGFITAVAGTVRELWNDLYRMQRKLFLNTASGTDLDELGAERGIARRGATSAGVLLTFTGKKGARITEQTPIINPSTGLEYLTQDTLELGIQNPDLNVNIDSNQEDKYNLFASPGLADTVWALCSKPGTMGNTQVNTINRLKSEIEGVISVNNLTPARGGTDAESDSLFRDRIRNQISLLNHGTEMFYETLCKSANSRILRVKAKKDQSRYDSIKLIIVTGDGVPLTLDEKRLLSDEIKKKQRAFTNVILEDVRFTFVTVKERLRFKPGYTMKDITVKTADALSSYFDYRTWEFGKSISIDNVFNVCYNVEGVEDIDLPTFGINSGNLKNASADQVTHSGREVDTASDSTVKAKPIAVPVIPPEPPVSPLPPFVAETLANKIVKVKRVNDIVDAKQIKSNTADTITIYGTWRINPAAGDTLDIMDLYRYTAKTSLFIDKDSLPYLEGIEITDVNNPVDNLLKISGIKSSYNPRNFLIHNQNQNQNQS